MRRIMWGALLAAALVAAIPALALGETKGAPAGEPREAVEARLLIDGRVVASFTEVSGLDIQVEQVAEVCREGRDDDCDGVAWERAALQAVWRVAAAADELEQTAWLTTRARHEIAMNAIRNIKARVRQVEDTLTDPKATLATKHDTVKNSVGNVRIVAAILTDTAADEAGVDKEAIERLTNAVRALDATGSGYIVRWRPGRPVYGNITMTGRLGSTDGMQGWFRQVVLDGKVERKSGSIIYLDRTGAEVMRYNFFEAWPCRFSATLTTEQMEFVVERIERAGN